jgi:hypothetical protein
MDLDKISNIFIITFLCVAALSLLIYVGYSVVINEMKKRAWVPTMKVGDDVHFSTNGDINGIISDIKTEGDFVEVKVLVKKSQLYPGKVREADDFIIS